MDKLYEVLHLSLKIFIVLLIIGIILPHILNKICEIFPFRDAIDTPQGNSTFVMSYVTESKKLIRIFQKIFISYFSYN